MSVKTSYKHCMTLIASATKFGKGFHEAVIEATKACIKHAREYHDPTVCIKLHNEIMVSCPGYVVNELVGYIKRVSPIEFEYGADKRTIVNAKEGKDKQGNLTKAYQADEMLDKVPFLTEKTSADNVSKRANQQIEPISYKWMKQRVSSMKNQLAKAIKEDGRGILGPDGKTYHTGDEGYQPIYDAYFNTFTNLEKSAEIVTPLALVPQEEIDEETDHKESLKDQADRQNLKGKPTLVVGKKPVRIKQAA